MQKWQVMLDFCASLGGSAIRSLMLVDMARSSKNVGLAAVKQAIDTDRSDRVGCCVVLQRDFGKVLGRLTAYHLPAVFRVEDGEVASALESATSTVVSDWAAHVGAHGTEGNDVAIGPHAARHGIAHPDGITGRAGIGV
ncbi:MAG: hypothetical protein ACD_23C01084G0002 [uncultured bacterium]|nr:MAG: hypothetical protein ACD_23C01084G0002 [uncultured bacterium]